MKDSASMCYRVLLLSTPIPTANHGYSEVYLYVEMCLERFQVAFWAYRLLKRMYRPNSHNSLQTIRR